MNRKEKIIAGVAAGIVVLLVAGLVFMFATGKFSGNDAAKRRHNTLALVHTYVDKGEFDRALSLLENLLIDLGVNLAGAALALQLLDELEAMQARLRKAGAL